MARARDKRAAARVTEGFKVREQVRAAEAARMLSELAAGVASGNVVLERAGQSVSLPLPLDLEMRLRAREELTRDRMSTKGLIRIRFSWGA